MAIAIKIPDIGTTTSTVRLVRWLKREGDSIKRGDFICEVETDKATSSLESIAEGTILKILVEEETEVDQGTVIAYVGVPGETTPVHTDDLLLPGSLKSTVNEIRSRDDRIKIPLVIKTLADKYGIDIKTISGTGPGGSITKEDILKAKERKEGMNKEHVSSESLSLNQAIVANQVIKSITRIPAIHLEAKVDMAGILSSRKRMKTRSGESILFESFFVKAFASAMIHFPHFRTIIEEDGKVKAVNESNIGVALSHDYELYIPVIRNCSGMTVLEIDSELRILVKKTIEGKFTKDDLTGATVSISNLGMYPVSSFQAIIPPEHVAVLSIGTIEDTVTWRNGQPAVLQMTIITLTVDHRLINGREAGEFIALLKKEIETI